MNFRLIPAGRYGKSTKRSTQCRHQANEGKSDLEAERVRVVGAVRSLRAKKKFVAEKRRETHFLSNEEKEKWIEDSVERETAGARKRVEDAEAVVQQGQEDMKHADIVGMTTRDSEKSCLEMLVAIVDSISDHASSDDVEDEDYQDDSKTEQGKLSDDDEPGWVMGTITKTVQQRMERFRPKQMKLDELTPPGWEDAPDYFRERDTKYSASELRVPAVVQLEKHDGTAAPAPTTFAELMEFLGIVPGISRIPELTSRPGSSHIRVGSVKPQLRTSISGLEPTTDRDTSPGLKAKPIEPVTFCPWIDPPINHHIDIGLRRRHGCSSCFSGRIYRQSVIFDVISLGKAMCIPILLRVSFVLISVTKL